jgi:hypothetical protein
MDVIAFTLLPDYEIALTFANGEQKQFDMKQLLTIKPWNRLLENNLYQQIRIDYGTLVWGDSIDIAPETLYLDSYEHATNASKQNNCASR